MQSDRGFRPFRCHKVEQMIIFVHGIRRIKIGKYEK